MSDEEAAADRPQVMPVFMGAPWAQRFGGSGADLKVGEWVTQTNYLAGLQGLTGQQKLQFVLSSLEGEAKREVLAAPEGNRNTAKAVFDLLTELYGDNTPVAALRAKFFNCRQSANQSLHSFSLQVRELFVRLKKRDSTGLGAEDLLMRDQFVMGLRDGPIRQNLRQQIRQNPDLPFDAIRKEAIALEQDQADTIEQPACMAASAVGASASGPTNEWKQELRAEIMQEVKNQMAELSKTLLDELRKGQSVRAPLLRERSYSEGARERAPGTSRPGPSRFQWDTEGRPICNRCGVAGHVSRQCPARRGSQGDF